MILLHTQNHQPFQHLKKNSQTLINYAFGYVPLGTSSVRNIIKLDMGQPCYITILVKDYNVGIVFHPTNKILATLFTSLDDAKEHFGSFKCDFFCCHNLGSTQLGQMLLRLGRNSVWGLLLLSQDTKILFVRQGQS